MQTCNLCREWAQWRVSRVIHQSAEERQRDEAKKLHPRGPDIEVIAFLCGVHKEKQQMPENLHLRFDFIGAMPCR